MPVLVLIFLLAITALLSMVVIARHQHRIDRLEAAVRELNPGLDI